MRLTQRNILRLLSLLLLAVGGTLLAAGQSTTNDDGFVAAIDIDSGIGPATAEYVDNASQQAIDDGAKAIVLRLDTPGGLSASMHEIINDILASPVPVLGYVAPEGARAASAGTYILYATHVAAMAPATHLGAATPVSMGGDSPLPAAGGSTASAASSGKAGNAERHKVVNDAIAYIRSLAKRRGRNADWAEKAVRNAATLTAGEAKAKNVIDLTAADTADLLDQASGRSVQLQQETRQLALSGLPVHTYAPDWRSRFLGVITNPTIAYLLLMAGIWGILLEVFHPGVMWPGVTGAICLLVGLYGMHMLPVNYAGLALMALGLILIVTEMFVPSFGALGLGGIIAFVGGSIMLMNTGVPGFALNVGVISGIAVGGIGVLALLLWALLHARRTHETVGDQNMLDAEGELLQAVSANGTSWARIHGERWQVHSDSDLPSGTPVRVTKRNGLVLWVAPRHD